MINTFKKIYFLLDKKEKKQLHWLLILIFIMGLLETSTIASIMPFMAVLAKPDIINTNQFLYTFYTLTGLTTYTQFLFFLGIGVLIVLIVSNGFAAFTTWRLFRFIYLWSHSLSYRLFERYLTVPYSFHLTHDSSELIQNIIGEVSRLATGMLIPAIQIITKTIITFCIFALLIYTDPLLAIIIFSVCGGLYGIVFFLSKNKLRVLGNKSTRAAGLRFKIVAEAFGGIKALKLLGQENEYLKRYMLPSSDYATCESASLAMTLLPKYALETILFGGMLIITLYLIRFKNDITQVLPMLVLYAFAGYRLAPGFNQIFNGTSQLRYHSASLDIVYQHFQFLPKLKQSTRFFAKQKNSFSFKKDLQLKNITFTFPKSQLPTISDLSLSIKPYTTVGLVGKSGSGKTTLLDIILGLLSIDSGTISVNGTTLTDDDLIKWQKNIGYVPQHIYLANDTVSKNIAFGIPDKDIDNHAVLRAANIANIHNFISKDLPQAYNTNLGERGLRLSGGQLQRIGIARALYNDPNILVLDEATNALDSLTEDIIMETIHGLSQKKTIILVSHRITTMKECDMIHVLEQGNIRNSGTYQELLSSCLEFQSMVQSEITP